MSRRRVNKLRNFVLSPQPLIDMCVKTLDSASYFITDSRFGLQLNTSYRFARIKYTSEYQMGNRYTVDGTKIYNGENLIKCKLEKHFGLHGPKYPVVGSVFRGFLKSEKAREAFREKPLFHETMGEAKKRPNHAILIMGINTDGEPKDHYVEILNSYGRKWGFGGYTNVVFKYIRNIMIPYFDKKVNSNGLKISTKKNANSSKESFDGVAKHLKPSVAGFLMEKHDYLDGTVSNPKKPFAAIIGGSKLSTKIDVIESLLSKVDILILGGGMVFTFYKSQGLEVGSSLVEEDKLDLATSLLEKAQAKGVSLILPSDVVIADKFASDAKCKTVPASSIPDGWMGLDIGPDSIKSFSESLDTTKTVIWIGPMGVFEFEKFAAGTEAIAHKLADLSGKGVSTIVGGGDLVAAVEKVGLADKMSYLQTGGGASLELIEGKPLPVVVALDEK